MLAISVPVLCISYSTCMAGTVYIMFQVSKKYLYDIEEYIDIPTYKDD